MPDTKQDIISKLRKDILLLGRGFKLSPEQVMRVLLVSAQIAETAFPNGVFPTGTIHEMLCPAPEQSAVTAGFIGGILAALMKKGGACLWISTSRKLFPPALMAFNVEPDRVIFIDLQQEKDVLWADGRGFKMRRAGCRYSRSARDKLCAIATLATSC